MRIRRKIKLYNGLKYRDDRLFVCNLTLSEVKDVEVKNGMILYFQKTKLVVIYLASLIKIIDVLPVFYFSYSIFT